MPPSSVPPRRPYSSVRPRGPLVLLAAGEESLREVCAAELVAAGFMVLEAHDGETALERAFQFGPQAVVLELELGLEAIDGLRVARCLRDDERTQHVSIVGLTATATRTLGTLALAAGYDTVLRKPVVAAALVGELVRLIARRSRTTREVSAALADAGREAKPPGLTKPAEAERAAFLRSVRRSQSR
jgi:DNA-binding response OmpR family regulator